MRQIKTLQDDNYNLREWNKSRDKLIDYTDRIKKSQSEGIKKSSSVPDSQLG
jgi:hypothetical protein